jgi:pyruvate/2-oxoglutarate dehydrogenase complex dihydrolipoamide dehydrogenase (E3) component
VKIVVIGGGPAGVVAACEAARTGAAVTLVHDTPVGGRAVHASMLPSKVFLHAADARRARGTSGLASDEELAGIRAEIERVATERAARMRSALEGAGVRSVGGVARFASARGVSVASEGKPAREHPFDRAIIAAGSVPRFPAGFLGDRAMPDGTHVLAPRFVRALGALPKTMLVIGGGVTGAEYAHAFMSLGVEVTWILDELGILPRFDRDLSDSFGDVIMERGVKIVHGKRVLSVVHDPQQGVLAKLDGGRTYAAERAFVAIGRGADTSRLGLAEVGVEMRADGSIVVDGFGRSSAAGIYAAGDAIGGVATQNRSEASAWIAARHATGQPVEARRDETFVEAVYTSPEIARVGLSPRETAARGAPFDLRTLDFGASLRGVLDGVGRDLHARGVIRVACEPDGGRLLGATAIGPRAAEALAPIAVALRFGATANDLASVFLASPTTGEVATAALR